MKKLVKLRYLTKEQWNKYTLKICNGTWCINCRFHNVNCSMGISENSWINNKDLYSDKFLDQEIEIEVPDILDKEENEYLSAVIKPFRKKIVNIRKQVRNFDDKLFYTITIRIESKTHILSYEFINLPYFKEDMYKGMEIEQCYTLEELGL